MRAGDFLQLRHPAIDRVRTLLVPTLFGGSVFQLNVLVATAFASVLPAPAVSYLWYADRVFEFPLGVVAVAVGTAALPSLAAHASASRFREMGHLTTHSLQLVWAICLPATAGLWMLADPIVTVLFERGEFTAHDATMTAGALRAFTAGLLGVGSARVLVSAFFALERLRVPVGTAVVALVVNAVLGLTSMNAGDAATALASPHDHVQPIQVGHTGLAWAISIAAAVHAGLLWACARRVLVGLDARSFVRSVARHCAATVAMAAALQGWMALIDTLQPPAATYLCVAGGVLLGAIVYVCAALAVGSGEIRELLAPLGRGGGQSRFG
jgi:putative peptidoglycan lipid II flippase